jgi:sulfide:quinone oxidoreductase
MAEDGWIPVDQATLKTKFPGVYAFGDVADVGVPKAGMFAEGEANAAAKSAIAEIRKGTGAGPYDGRASCYVEFGSGLVGRTDMDFLSGPFPKGRLPREVCCALRGETGSGVRTHQALVW